ncbi:MAG: clan AA aspartic protease [Planctomycetes bacterium]|nr:clan AA aspartic protease [Planctomycetota bacterium]
MGEVRVEVELTSVADQVLARQGYKKPSEIRRTKVSALVDTGAVQCVVPPFVADTLGLARTFRKVVEVADGRKQEVDVTEPALMVIMGRPTYEQCLVLGDEVIVGQTALESTDLHVDCREGKLLPNPAHPDQPVVKIKRAG